MLLKYNNSVSIDEFVESLINTTIKEEWLNNNTKIKYWKDYKNLAETKSSLAKLFKDWYYDLMRNFDIRDVEFYASKKNGLSNYITITYVLPQGVRRWLGMQKIRFSDHPPHNKDFNRSLKIVGKSVNELRKELDKIIQERTDEIHKSEEKYLKGVN